ncbi:serine hydrolase [Amycolatopsis orientalis]|uniref:serine hydrolase n=1 Tax=Amycolatopsis orientalis TaxID=31958 RepID=UPI0004058F08|nr:serine hydrolase [Amycolatopsis orientalis]
MLTRRHLLAGAAAGSAALLLPGTANAAGPDRSTEQGWLDWLAFHRRDVSALIDDGAGRRAARNADVRRVLASSIKVVHLSAYAVAVAEGRLDPREEIRVGDWDAHHPFVADGRAHFQALNWLGVPCDDYGIAKDPEQRVPLARIPEAMILFSDNAAADYLRTRLGDPALQRAAARGGWRRPDTRSFGGEVLMLMMPEHLPPPGSPAAVRRAMGDVLARRFVRDPGFRAEAMRRWPEMPSTSEGQWPWTQGHGQGSASDLFALHRGIANGLYPPAREILARPLSDRVPPGASEVLFKGGSLPRTLTVGLSVRWSGGRSGTAAVLLTGVSDQEVQNAGPLIDVLIAALAAPERFEALRRALG